MDIEMPIINGIEATGIISERFAEMMSCCLPLVMISFTIVLILLVFTSVKAL